jgi:Rhomboid-like protein
VAGLLVARLPLRWRTLYITAISGLLATVLLLDRTFTDLGHAVAWLIGLAWPGW